MKKMPKFFDSARVRAHKNSAFAKILLGARPRALELYQKSSLALYDNLKDITKVFKRIAFVGPCSHYLLEMVAADNTISSFKPQALTICDPSEMSLEYSKQMQTSKYCSFTGRKLEGVGSALRLYPQVPSFAGR